MIELGKAISVKAGELDKRTGIDYNKEISVTIYDKKENVIATEFYKTGMINKIYVDSKKEKMDVGEFVKTNKANINNVKQMETPKDPIVKAEKEKAFVEINLDTKGLSEVEVLEKGFLYSATIKNMNPNIKVVELTINSNNEEKVSYKLNSDFDTIIQKNKEISLKK